MVAVPELVLTAAVVVAVTVPILLLKVDQSEEDNKPLLPEEAVGILKVCTPLLVLILKSEPPEPVANV